MSQHLCKWENKKPRKTIDLSTLILSFCFSKYLVKQFQSSFAVINSSNDKKDVLKNFSLMALFHYQDLKIIPLTPWK